MADYKDFGGGTYADRPGNKFAVKGRETRDYNEYLNWGGISLDSEQANPGQAAQRMQDQIKADRLALEAKQKAEEDSLLTDYTGKVSGQETLGNMATRIGGELGLGDARQSAFDLMRTLKNIPTVQNQATRGYDVNDNQRQRIIAQKQGEIAPSAMDAASRQQFLEGQLGERLGYGVADQAKELKPLELRASLLSDRLSREMTGYTQDKQSQLTLYLDQLQAGRELSMQELQNANNLAMAQQDYQLKMAEYSKPVVLGTNDQLYNPQTGQLIAGNQRSSSPAKPLTPVGYTNALDYSKQIASGTTKATKKPLNSFFSN